MQAIEDKRAMETPLRNPARHFVFLLTLSFTIYASWHIMMGQLLRAYLPSIPGQLPKDDPVRSLYDAFTGSFLFGFLSVFFIVMFINASFFLAFLKPPKRMIYAIAAVTGFAVDVAIIIYLEKLHGPWGNVYWQDLRSYWRAVSVSTGIVALAGAMAATLLSYAFFSPDDHADGWRRRKIFDAGWLAVIVIAGAAYFFGLADFVFRQFISTATVALVTFAIFLLQSVPYLLIVRRCFPQQKRANVIAAFLMPLFCTFILAAIFLTLLGFQVWRLG